MSTKVIVAIQNLNPTTYAKHKLFITVDPAFGIGGNSPFLLEAKIRRVSFGINENVGVAELEYPDRPFGSHLGGFVLPVALFVDNYDNFVFRGFMTDEIGILNNDNDQLNAVCYDYKWLINRISKIKGKVYTVDNDIRPQFTPGNTKVFADESLYEKFRMVIPGLNKSGNDITDRFFNEFGTGFLSGRKTIFNENGDPDCATAGIGNACFMFDADYKFNRETRIRTRRTNRYFWNYASILEHICKFYITNVYSGVGGTTSILINRTSLSNIIRYGEKYGEDTIRPINFDITNLSPMEAIDKVVKNIPGTWYWTLSYFPHSVVINIFNHSEPELQVPGKSLFVGDGGKLNDKTNNNVNVVDIKIKKSAKNAISHAIAMGRNIELETTIGYIPAWPQYLRPLSDLQAHTSVSDYAAEVSTVWNGKAFASDLYVSDFKGIQDYINWKQYAYKDNSTSIVAGVTTEDEKRYALIYRAYVFPESAEQLSRFPDIELSYFLDGYEDYAQLLKDLFFRYVLVPRKIKSPVTRYRNLFQHASFTDNYSYKNTKQQLRDKHTSDPPFVFLYDALIGQTYSNETHGLSGDDVLRSKQWILPEESKKNHYSLQNDNRVIVFQQPQFQRKTLSVVKAEDNSFPSFADAISRKVFVTCRIECDVPLIRDKISRREFYSNARLVSQVINPNLNAVIRVNALFPNPYNFIGNQFTPTQDSDDDLNSTITNDGAETSDVGSKLVDWNKVDFDDNTPDGNLIVDDSSLLDQLISFLIDKGPVYEIEGDAELGRIDTSYQVGDKIDNIVGSELADGTGGYYSLDAVLEKLEYSAVNDRADSFNTKMSFKNSLPYVLFLTNGETQGIPKD